MHWVAARESRARANQAAIANRAEGTSFESLWETILSNGEKIMAKPLPRIDGTETTQQPKPVEQKAVTIEAGPRDNYQLQLAAFKNVNANLPRDHQILMRDTLRHLQDTGESLNDGTEVTDKTKVVLWLLENASLT